MSISFKDLNISPNILESLEKKGYESPTEIQVKLIEKFSECKNDLIAQAQTGTGKTAAYGIPILDSLSDDSKDVQALILTPTRELTLQVCKELKEFNYHQSVRVCAILGGESIERQRSELKRNPAVVVGSPGRIIDHIKRKNLNISKLSYLVLDEADEMLNNGFIEDVEYIIGKTPSSKRTLFVSATINATLRSLANNYLNDYISINTKTKNSVTSLTEQIYYEVKDSDKTNAICRIFDTVDDLYGIVFCQTKRDVDAIAQELMKRGYPAEGLHGDLSQHQRNRILGLFRQKKYSILVATDVAARGIDIMNLSHVFNLSLPQDNESYVHRIGRTGRAGKKGTAITIISPREFYRLNRLQKMLKITIKKERIPSTAQIKDKKAQLLTNKIADQNIDGETQLIDKLYSSLSENLNDKELIKKCLQTIIRSDITMQSHYDVEDLFDKSSHRAPRRDSSRKESSRKPFRKKRFYSNRS